ncbi:MAG: hypothetical protein J0L64_06055 [Acidobacteria bacterium]|nr:hypothetical protein [Acidobacteriota bacterium]
MNALPSHPALRLFLTCWLVYALHFATNTVREIYLGLAIGDHLSFRVDEYGGLHHDLFETPGRGWHIGNNPGASMLGAIPYALARPVIDRIVERVNRSRASSGLAAPPAYDSPWAPARKFYAEAWRRGLDVKFGLGAFVMHAFCMAPLSALGVVVMFFLLRRMMKDEQRALWFSLLYAFGTPLFFRTGYLNQNMLVGHCILGAFAALTLLEGRRAALIAGFLGGFSLLLDYSGAVALGCLFLYAALLRRDYALPYAIAAAPPILLLWFYQWASFGHPFYPGQHYMPPVEWVDRGYQGVSGPQWELLWMLAFDYRFGLFVSCPLLLAAAAAPLLRQTLLTKRQLSLLLLLFVLFWTFFSTVNYTRLQYNTGVRYMAPMIPVLFLPAAAALARLSRPALYFVSVAALGQAWCMAMYRDVERGWGVLDPVLHVLLAGFQLPALTTLNRMNLGMEALAGGVSPLPLFAFTGALVYGIWRRA